MSADNGTIIRAEAQLNKAALQLGAIANDVADAKTIKEFNSDRLKRILAFGVAGRLDSGESAVAAEHKTRAGEAYGQAFFDLQEQYKSALRVIETHDALKIKFESARSILSTEKAKLGLL